MQNAASITSPRSLAIGTQTRTVILKARNARCAEDQNQMPKVQRAHGHYAAASSHMIEAHEFAVIEDMAFIQKAE